MPRFAKTKKKIFINEVNINIKREYKMERAVNVKNKTQSASQ